MTNKTGLLAMKRMPSHRINGFFSSLLSFIFVIQTMYIYNKLVSEEESGKRRNETDETR